MKLNCKFLFLIALAISGEIVFVGILLLALDFYIPGVRRKISFAKTLYKDCRS